MITLSASQNSSQYRSQNRFSVYSIIAAATVLLLSSVQYAEASGGYSRDSNRGYNNSAPRRSYQPRQPQVDSLYERGQSIYTGRVASYSGVKLCVADSGLLNSDTAAGFESRNDLADALQVCSSGQSAWSVLAAGDIHAVTHYMNKRYSLGY